MLRGFTTLQSHFIKTYPDVWMYINGFICGLFFFFTGSEETCRTIYNPAKLNLGKIIRVFILYYYR